MSLPNACCVYAYESNSHGQDSSLLSLDQCMTDEQPLATACSSSLNVYLHVNGN